MRLLENTNFLPAIIIFLVAYGIIISEKLNRTVVALLGAIAMVVFHILSQEEAFHVIDFNTIGLLVGMMTIVNILKRTGIFQYLSDHSRLSFFFVRSQIRAQAVHKI